VVPKDTLDPKHLEEIRTMVADGLKPTMEVIDVASCEILANKPCLELSRVLVGFPACKKMLNKKYKFLTDARKRTKWYILLRVRRGVGAAPEQRGHRQHQASHEKVLQGRPPQMRAGRAEATCVRDTSAAANSTPARADPRWRQCA
jgi:hypothetical protein